MKDKTLETKKDSQESIEEWKEIQKELINGNIQKSLRNEEYLRSKK